MEISSLWNIEKVSLQVSIPIHTDNQASIHIAKIPSFDETTKHIGIRYNYI